MVLSCRLCLTEDSEEKLKNVFQCNVQHAEDSLVDVLFWVFSVEIDVTDPFSKSICSDCIQLIEYILQVKNTFQKNQESLRNHSQNQDYGGIEVPTLDDSFNKISNNRQRSSSCSTTPPTSPSKSRYISKNMYGTSSPRVRVSISTLEAMCPMNLNLEPLENTQEYLRYRRLKNGSFKKRKYRYFNMDGALLDDICNTLEDKCNKTEPSKKEIGVLTEDALFSKALNTDERILCTCTNNITSLEVSTAEIPSKDLLINDKTNEGSYDKLHDNILDIIGITKEVKSTVLSSHWNEDYDWTTMTFKKDGSTNTENTLPDTKNIGINATVHTTTTGTLTEVFEQMKNKNVVKVNIDSLVDFGPKIVLEPLEDILEEINYKQIDNFRYIKKDCTFESETEEILEQDVIENETEEVLGEDEIDFDKSRQQVAINKKQRFLDYYKNFSSFAVRELIAGKKIRESDSETSTVFKIANVCSVFVCDFCSKSFLSKLNLDLHYKRAHKWGHGSNDVIEVIDLVDSENMPIRNRKFPTRVQKRRRKPTSEKSKTVKKMRKDVETRDCTTEANTGTSAKHTEDVEDKSKDSSNNEKDDMKRKIKGKQKLLKVRRKIRRKRKFKRLGNPTLGIEERKDMSYIWDRKSLGKYSAISYYRNYLSDEKEPHLNLVHCDINHKQDLGLNETIRKLTNRLDIDTCDEIDDTINMN